MKSSYHVFLTCLAAMCAAVRSQGIDPPTAFTDMQSTYTDSILSTLPSGECTEENILVRRSWDDMSSEDRTAYIDAVKCMRSNPPIADLSTYSGNRNRMDDFAVSHANVTKLIHSSGFLLPWHRYFTWSYENALRTECGYTGAQPYWDISRWEGNIEGSALFDGSATSLGGNGEYIPGRDPKETYVDVDPPFEFNISAGTGGGCVTTGPFVPMFNVTIGPVTPGNPPADDPEGRRYNPRCLTRDFLPDQLSQFLSWQNVTDKLALETIHEFRPEIESATGIHGPMHATVGGEALDFYLSPIAPEFYFLHSWLDRVWSIWQGQDFETRRDGLNGTQTMLDRPPSDDVTVDTIMEFGYAGGEVRVGDVMSTTSGPFCYRYE